MIQIQLKASYFAIFRYFKYSLICLVETSNNTFSNAKKNFFSCSSNNEMKANTSCLFLAPNWLCAVLFCVLSSSADHANSPLKHPLRPSFEFPSFSSTCCVVAPDTLTPTYLRWLICTDVDRVLSFRTSIQCARYTFLVLDPDWRPHKHIRIENTSTEHKEVFFFL